MATLLLRENSNLFPHNLIIYLCVTHCIHSVLSIGDTVENEIGSDVPEFGFRRYLLNSVIWLWFCPWNVQAEYAFCSIISDTPPVKDLAVEDAQAFRHWKFLLLDTDLQTLWLTLLSKEELQSIDLIHLLKGKLWEAMVRYLSIFSRGIGKGGKLLTSRWK